MKTIVEVSNMSTALNTWRTLRDDDIDDKRLFHGRERDAALSFVF